MHGSSAGGEGELSNNGNGGDHAIIVTPKGPSMTFTLRNWYVANYCTEDHVQQVMDAQAIHPTPWVKGCNLYYHLWAEVVSGAGFMIVLGTIVYSGHLKDGLHLFFLLASTLYLTDILKDYFGCPRPPCPPLRRGGKQSHGIEYGWPSTHTACSIILAWDFGRLLMQNPNLSSYWIIVAGAVVVLHVSFSRLYLGLHWVGDIWGGLVVAALVLLVDAAFVRDWFMAFASNPFHFPLWLPLWLGHLAQLFHTAPADFCPCFLDSIRIVGALAGALSGAWQLQAHASWHSHLPVEKLLVPRSYWSQLSVEGIARIIFCLVVSVTLQTVTKALGKPIVRKVLHWLAKPSGNERTGPIAWVKCFIGFLLGKPISLASTPEFSFPAAAGGPSEGTTDTSEIEVRTHSPLSASPSQSDTTYAVPIGLSSATQSSASSASRRAGEHGQEDGNQKTADRGGFWSLRNHIHWWEDEVQCLFLSYAALGFSMMYIAPVGFLVVLEWWHQ
jgi:membrane-associated phospholipid phosphatase